MQQPLTPTDIEQNAAGTSWLGPALSHTTSAQSFPGTMLLAGLQTPLSAQMHTLLTNQWGCIASHSTV